jgi:hypothetical protein
MAACVLYGAITGRDPRESTYVPFPLDPSFAAHIRAVAAASLSEVPDRPAGDVIPTTTLAAGFAASGGNGKLNEPARTPAVAAKVSRASAKQPAPTGHVAASIADFLGRAPGETEAPVAAPIEPMPRTRADDAPAATADSEPATLDVPTREPTVVQIF